MLSERTDYRRKASASAAIRSAKASTSVSTMSAARSSRPVPCVTRMRESATGGTVNRR
jgi:hypothetical protein